MDGHIIEGEMSRTESSSSSLSSTSSTMSMMSNDSPVPPIPDLPNDNEDNQVENIQNQVQSMDQDRDDPNQNVNPITVDTDVDVEEDDDVQEPPSVEYCGRCMSTQAMQSLYELRQNNLLCDATIRLEDGGVFLVHRAILSACSSYFRTLFTTIFYAQEKTDVFVPGVTTEIMNSLLKYAYLRSLDITHDNVCQLLMTANYLNIFGVLDICRTYLRDSLVPQNCIGILKFAREHCCKQLEIDAHGYIMRNIVEIIEKSVEILGLSVDELCQLIDADELNVKDEESVWEFIVKWIDHDPDNRKQYISQLLRVIRLGLLETQYFLQKIKSHPYVAGVESCRPIVTETLTFFYDLELGIDVKKEFITPKLARLRVPHEILFVYGGWIGNNPMSLIETYDTRADRWIPLLETGVNGGGRGYHGAAVIGFDIYIIGGYNGIEYFNSCRCFNAVSKTWREVAPMNFQRCYFAVAVLDDIIYAIGGFDGLARLNTAERYNYRTNQWSLIAPMNVRRSDAGAASLNKKVYVVGGFNSYECVNTAEVYDPETNQWTMIPPMRSRRIASAAIAYHNCIYVIGGFNGISRLSSCEKYNPSVNTWTHIPKMYNPRSNFAAAIIDDTIFAIGGYNGVTSTFYVECYDEASNDWYEATDLNIYRCGHSASVIVGLPNAHDYIHKHRENLLEEDRQKLLAIELQGSNQNPQVVRQQNQQNQQNQLNLWTQ